MTCSFTPNSSELYVLADRVCDYVPGVSTFVNLHHIFRKHSMLSEQGFEASMDAYTVYIQQKSFFRCILLLVPIIGNLSIVLLDLILPVYTINKLGDLPPHREREDRNCFETIRSFSSTVINEDFNHSPESTYQEIHRSISFKTQTENSSDRRDLHVIKQVAHIRQCFQKVMTKSGPYFKFYKQGFQQTEQSFDLRLMPENSSDYIKTTIENIMACQEALYSLDCNGYTVSESDTRELLYTRFIDLSRVGYSPWFFTGILGLESTSISQLPIPSWELVTILCELTDDVIIAAGIEQLQEINFSSEHRPLFIQTRQKALQLCKQMKEHYCSLTPLFDLFATNLVDLSDVHWSFFQKMQQNKEKHDAFSLEDSYYSSFTGFDWDALKKNLVAERKFFFKSAYSDSICAQILEPMHQAATKTSEQSKWVRSQCIATSFVYGTAGYLTMGPYGAATALIPTLAMRSESDNVQKRWKQEISKTQSLAQLANKPRLKGFYKNSAYRSHLILDLAKRKIEWIEKPLRSQIVLTDIAVFPHAPETSFFVKPHSLFKKAVLGQIEKQTLPSNDYRNSVTSLIDEYQVCLRRKLENQRIDSTHLLHPLNTGIIVCGEEEGAIPLILPKKLMIGLEKEFSSVRRDLMQTGRGGLVPFYTFSTDEGKLRIVFKTWDQIAVGTVLVAKFDVMAVRAFQPDLTSSSQSFDPSEFLLQALYGSMINKCLGLPGLGSLALKRQVLAPQEREFVGCYRLWENHPDKVISYNSEANNGEEADFERAIFQKLQVVPTAYYSELVSELYNIKHCQIGEKIEYDRISWILRGLTTLLSSTKWSEVEKTLEKKWGFVSSEKLYDFDQPLDCLPNLSLGAAKALQDDLLANPSEEVITLQKKMKRFDRIIALK